MLDGLWRTYALWKYYIGCVAVVSLEFVTWFRNLRQSCFLLCCKSLKFDEDRLEDHLVSGKIIDEKNLYPIS